MFISVAVIGILVLVASLVLGELFDFSGDVSVDGPSAMSSSVLSAALAVFGIAGATATASGASGVLAGAIGVASGGVMAFVIFTFIQKPLAKQQGNSHLDIGSYVGLTARVTLAIPDGNGWGEVRFSNANNASVTRRAWSSSGTAIETGSVVRIKEAMSDGVVVEPTT